jgi:hypothetical protein
MRSSTKAELACGSARERASNGSGVRMTLRLADRSHSSLSMIRGVALTVGV